MLETIFKERIFVGFNVLEHLRSSVVVSAFNPNTGKRRKADLHEFKSSLAHTAGTGQLGQHSETLLSRTRQKK